MTAATRVLAAVGVASIALAAWASYELARMWHDTKAVLP